jgi:hypothetical protein
MLTAQSQAEFDVQNALALADERRAEVKASGSQLGHFLNNGGYLLREECNGLVRWCCASRNGLTFHPEAVLRQAWRGRLQAVPGRDDLFMVNYDA